MRIFKKKDKDGIVKNTKGLSTVEYIIILILIAVGGIALWTTFGDTVGGKIEEATGEVEGL